MNPDTGEIRTFRHQSEATAAGFTINLTDEEVKYLHSIPEAERQAWLLANKHRGVPHVHQHVTRELVKLDAPGHLSLSDEHLWRASNNQDKPAEKRTRLPGPGGQLTGRFKVRK